MARRIAAKFDMPIEAFCDVRLSRPARIEQH
jgi:hypothetical protein